MALLFDVFFDDFIRDVTRTDAEVAARPQVASPELLPQVWKFMHHLVGRLTFQHLHQSADGHLWRQAEEQMHVVAGDVPFDNRHFRVAADFADQLTESETYFTRHHGLAVLRHPDDVQMDAKDRMCAVPIVGHRANLSHGTKPAKAFA